MMKRTAWITYVGLAFGLGLATGCKSDEQKEFEADMARIDKERAAEAKKKPVDADLFGKTVASPTGSLSKVAIGMPVADARAAAPDLFEDDDDYQLTDHPTYKDVRLGLGSDDKTSKVSSLNVSFPTDARAALETAWGKGTDGKDTIDRPITYWFNPETGWRAMLEAGFDDLKVEFFNYMPAEKLLGEGKDKLGFEPQSTLGATADEIRTRFPKWVVETDQATAEAERKKLEAFTDQKLDDLGTPKPDIRLDLPPTEYEQFWTRVHFSFDDANKVEQIRLGLAYGNVPTARDQLLAAFKKKWGEPKEGEDYSGKFLVFNENPYVKVQDNTIMKAWDVAIELPEPAEPATK